MECRLFFRLHSEFAKVKASSLEFGNFPFHYLHTIRYDSQTHTIMTIHLVNLPRRCPLLSSLSLSSSPLSLLLFM